jgi:hypothetical protein
MPDLGAASTKSTVACAKFKRYIQRFARRNESWYVYPRWSIIYMGAASPKNSILTIQKWKMHFSWDKTKINLRGVPRHPKGHGRVRYGLVLTNYAMIRAKPSSSDLKAMQPRTRGRSFFWRDFLVNCFYQGLNFFPHLGDIKWCHMKVSHFFDFFWISYARFGSRMKMTMHETPAQVQAVRSHALTVKV